MKDWRILENLIFLKPLFLKKARSPKNRQKILLKIGSHMMLWILLFPLLAWANDSMLLQANVVNEKYFSIISKEPTPLSCPKTEAALSSSVWFTIDLHHMAKEKGQKALDILGDPRFLGALKEIGVEGIYVKGLEGKDPFSFCPQWGNYFQFLEATQRWGFSLASQGPKAFSSLGEDFFLALENQGEYPSLFHLVEIEEKNWQLLPKTQCGELTANISWLQIQRLQKEGYIPDHFRTYSSQSCWNATREITGVDGKVRRWIYLKEKDNLPVFNWLSPSFSAYRIASSAILETLFQKRQKWIALNAQLPPLTKEMLSTWIRKLKGFSLEELAEFPMAKQAKSDLIFDTFTRRALLDAMITENVAVLRYIYQIFQKEGIEPKRWIHALEPFDTFACSWDRLLSQFPRFNEQATNLALSEKLLKQDLYALEKKDRAYIAPTTWVDHCRKALNIENVEAQQKEIQKAHLLLAFTYALQPGAFFFSASDLLGILPEDALSLRLLDNNPAALYPSLFVQMQSPLSFASKLKEILEIRKKFNVATAKILAIPKAKNPSCFLLVQELSEGNFLVLAVNFGRKKIRETLNFPFFANCFPIDLLESQAIEKSPSSPSFCFSLLPLSGKVFLLQKKYYE